MTEVTLQDKGCAAVLFGHESNLTAGLLDAVLQHGRCCAAAVRTDGSRAFVLHGGGKSIWLLRNDGDHEHEDQ